MLLTAKALLLKKGIETKRHKGIITEFYKSYVLKENFDKIIFQNFARLQSLRYSIFRVYNEFFLELLMMLMMYT